MGLFIFQHPKTGKIVEIVLGINDEKIYIDKKGVKWDRVYTAPQMSVDTKIDPSSASEFDRKFANKKHSIGDLWDSSAELSQKREKIMGKDPIKEKSIENYAKDRKGRKPRMNKDSN